MKEVKEYIKFNVEKTERLIQKIGKDKTYTRLKKANKMNTWRFVKGQINRKWDILDIGCRDGMWLDILKSNNYKKLQGMDVSEKALDMARKKGHNVLNGDAHELPFPDESFNFVSIIHTLEHCPDVEKVMREIYRVLKPNGRILVVVPLQKKEKVPTVWAHYHCFSKTREVSNLLIRNGFKKIKIQSKQRPHNRFLFKKVEKNESIVSDS